ncbi:MAG TPA: VCBS repeat-containing protein, partial [Sumerlaeia bacterium]|nr:VCBS repeat-containing protein [Sumerlaeia bacterium]
GDFDLVVSLAEAQSAGYGRGQDIRVLLFENAGGKTTPAFLPGVDMGIYDSYGDPAGGHISLCDIDGDGDYDLFSGWWISGHGEPPYLFRFFRNDGTPANYAYTFVTENYFPELEYDECMIPTFFDADLDGDNDCILFTWTQSYWGLMRNVGTLSSPAWKLTHDFFQTLTYKQLNRIAAWGDLDNDGDLDMIQLGEYLPFGFFENRGSRTEPNWTLKAVDFVPHVGRHYSPCLYDIDDDGLLELFSVRFRQTSGEWASLDHDICFWENSGTPTSPSFSLADTKWQGITGLRFTGMSFGDLNGDNLPDLVMGAYGTNQVYFFPNEGAPGAPAFDNGSRTVLVVPSPPGPHSYQYPHLADVDLDGDMDLFVGVDGEYARGAVSYAGQVNFFRNTGSPGSPSFVLEDPMWMGLNMHWEVQVSSGDVDGDGAPNIFVSDRNGGILHFRPVLDMLDVYPSNATLVSGQSVDYITSGGLGSASAQILENRSGGELTGLTYTAGSTTGVVDRIKFSDSGSSKTAYAYVNVISPSQISISGKAVVMAGRKAIDPLWSTTNNLAHFVYRTLLYRGFSKENVYYLNPDTAQDADGNGAQDDIDAASTLANVETALTTFAAGSPNLFVYLIDHGGEYAANAYVRCNDTQILYASLLDQWLDALQNSGTTTLTLVVDCCQSGGFLDRCHATGAQQRVAIGSADYLEPAFFSAGGLISFTNAFVGGLYSGLTVGEAFNLAAGAVDRYQRPQLDDDGDGVYDKDADGDLAKRLTVGASFIAGADRPQIGKISANHTLTGGGATATIWASDVSSVYPIDRVWATIAAPGFLPDSALDPANPVTNLPELDLIWSATNSRYEATTNTFTEMGAYAVNIYARDIWGGVSYPKQTYINQMESDEQIVIVCGDGAYDSNSPWTNSDYLARFVYETARARWLAHDKISYLTSAASSPDRPVDGAPSEAALAAAISAASGVGKLTVYLVGSGDASALDIDGDGAASDPDDLTPAELDSCLDALQSGGSTRVIVVLDFNRSGGWISTLTASAGQERIIIASSRNSEDSWCEAGGALSFTQWFFSWVFNGVNLRDAFSWARWAVRGVTSETQNPQLDDDGSGAANRLDGALALTTYIGAAFVTGAE